MSEYAYKLSQTLERVNNLASGKISSVTEKMLREYNSTINFNGYTERDLTSRCGIISILSISWDLRNSNVIE